MTVTLASRFVVVMFSGCITYRFELDSEIAVMLRVLSVELYSVTFEALPIVRFP